MYKEFLEIVGNGNPTDSVLEETIAVSATIHIAWLKFHLCASSHGHHMMSVSLRS